MGERKNPSEVLIQEEPKPGTIPTVPTGFGRDIPGGSKNSHQSLLFGREPAPNLPEKKKTRRPVEAFDDRVNPRKLAESAGLSNLWWRILPHGFSKEREIKGAPAYGPHS